MNMNTATPRLFSQVIMESGGPTARAVYPFNHPMHKQQLDEFLALVGASELPEDQVMDFLRGLPMMTIRSASETIFQRYNPSLRWPFQPVIDGPDGMVPVAPIEAWRSGNWHRVPILTGFNTNEGGMFVPKQMESSDEFTAFFHTLFPQFSPEDLKALDGLYPDPSTNPSSPYVDTRSGVGPQFKRVEAAYAHFAYIAPVRLTASLASSKDNSPAHIIRPPVYLYEFAVNRSVIGGANHGDENEYVSYNPDPVKFSRTQRAIAGEMHAYWTSFIVAGDPNAVRRGKYKHRPHWPAYGQDTQEDVNEKIVFGAGSDERAGGVNKGIVSEVRPDVDGQTQCEFWWSKVDLFEALPPAETATLRAML